MTSRSCKNAIGFTNGAGHDANGRWKNAYVSVTLPTMITCRDGNILLNGEKLEIGFLSIERELSRGANGVVFLANDPLLSRPVAIKIWTSLRKGDIRNKALQGESESRKAWNAQREGVARLFFAGYSGEVFYTVMEFIEGETLKSWLSTKGPTVGAKCCMAERLINLDTELQKCGIVHGDLHWKNIMVLEDTTERSYFDLTKHKRWNLKVLDFGTSFYSGKKESRERHYRLLVELVNKCIAPFDVELLEASPKPKDLSREEMTVWLLSAIYSIRAGFYKEGVHIVGWPLYRAFGTHELTTEGFGLNIANAQEQVKQFLHGMSRDTIRSIAGESPEWGPFDGISAKRED